MRYNRIIVTGCSFVDGGHLYGTGFHQDHFMIHLQRKLKIPCDERPSNQNNLAKNGASNDYITRVLTSWLIKNKTNVKNTLFIVGLTELSRIEYYDNVGKQYRTFWSHEPIDTGWFPEYWEQIFSGVLDKNKSREWNTNLYKYTYDESVRADELYLKLLMIQNFIQMNGGNMVIFSSLCPQLPNKEHFNYMKITENDFTWSQYIRRKYGWEENDHNPPTETFIDSYVTPCMHPGPLANRELADKLYNYILTNLILKK